MDEESDEDDPLPPPRDLQSKSSPLSSLIRAGLPGVTIIHEMFEYYKDLHHCALSSSARDGGATPSPSRYRTTGLRLGSSPLASCACWSAARAAGRGGEPRAAALARHARAYPPLRYPPASHAAPAGENARQ